MHLFRGPAGAHREHVGGGCRYATRARCYLGNQCAPGALCIPKRWRTGVFGCTHAPYTVRPYSRAYIQLLFWRDVQLHLVERHFDRSMRAFIPGPLEPMPPWEEYVIVIIDAACQQKTRKGTASRGRGSRWRGAGGAGDGVCASSHTPIASPSKSPCT